MSLLSKLFPKHEFASSIDAVAKRIADNLHNYGDSSEEGRFRMDPPKKGFFSHTLKVYDRHRLMAKVRMICRGVFSKGLIQCRSYNEDIISEEALQRYAQEI